MSRLFRAHRWNRHALMVSSLVLAWAALSSPTVAAAQNPARYPSAVTTGTTPESASGVTIRVLVDSSVMAGLPVEMVEITFPAGGTARAHRHGSTELIYVLSGTLDHIVNGTTHTLTAGMVGVVRAGDEVVHQVLYQEPVRVLVLWTPTGELARLRPGFRER